ncbi:BTE_collapsed_G0044490.mRNA.1.CDS.1 [Saccharomyces cerevisiae]|nr:BTE_collapsed_G0044490.mRNA.1.CDS.1 [Saccharomyces cerevisiae]
MALERIPADMRKSGQVCRMSDPRMIKEIMEAVSIPVMAKVRIGHFVEAQIALFREKRETKVDTMIRTKGEAGTGDVTQRRLIAHQQD